MNIIKAVTALTVAGLPLGPIAATAQSVEINADPRARIIVDTAAPAQDSALLARVRDLLTRISMWAAAPAQPAKTEENKPDGDAGAGQHDRGHTPDRTKDKERAKDTVKPASGVGNSGADKPKPAQSSSPQFPAEESIPDVMCLVAAKGSGQMKALTLTVAANRPVAGAAELSAVSIGHNSGYFSVAADIDLQKGEARDFVLATTNMTKGAHLEAKAIIKGAEYRCR